MSEIPKLQLKDTGRNINPAKEKHYEYPLGHRCRGCPYTMRTSVPSCMFPQRRDGGCFWHDYKTEQKQKRSNFYGGM